MKRVLTVAFIFTFFTATAQTDGYEIKVSFKPFKNQYIYLGHYFGAKQYPILDSVMLDEKSEGVFKGNKKLGRGIYLLGFPNKSGFYEFLMDFDQRFTIRVDTTGSLANIYFENSDYNNEFTAYQRYMGEKGSTISNLTGRLTSAVNKNDSIALQNQITGLDSEIAKYRDSLINKNPKGILARLLTGMKEPVLAPPYSNPKNKADSLYAYRYYKDHFWDGVDFWDDLFARTTFFEGKLDKYFEQLVVPNADSVIKEMDYMLGFATAVSPDMTRFLLAKFINRYYNQKYMWEDAVFVHLYEKYLANKDYPWMNANGKKMVTDRAYSLMANILGTPAADIELPDSTGKKISLYDVTAPFTVVCFWDATCSHCKEILPRIDSIYKAKWKAAGVKIFSVSKETTGNIKDWKQYIREHKLGWVNVFYSRVEEHTRVTANIPGYSQLYDVQSFPTLYLLDKDKRIIAKKLGFDQLDDIIDLKLKKTN